MLIGQLAAQSGFSRDTIRYYEKVGLIERDSYDRQTNNYKRYSEHSLSRLRQIRELKGAGFTLVEIGELLASFNENAHPCTGLQSRLTDKISALDLKIQALQQFKHAIQRISESCDSRCSLDDGLPTCMK